MTMSTIPYPPYPYPPPYPPIPTPRPTPPKPIKGDEEAIAKAKTRTNKAIYNSYNWYSTSD